ncbi:hypothetical protein C8T65DRAFT_583702 [Cerioporus squamosus]|nr:hypothetical protein C8T65DRAFT_750556 [Cerioporus squamosus]KAI0684666.1 hypothetical protein C8T65DRAFT_593407 [Cerioporus squamosus]KAI0696145.1 hypothetical protein C8T65DRAFT_583702 [Cerioporus squamosus]
MGRAPRYQTSEARTTARTAAVRRYAQTASGKAARAAASARNYTKRKMARDALLGVDLPRDMRQYARSFRRASFLFAAGWEDLELGLWCHPFAIRVPDTGARSSLTKGERGSWDDRSARVTTVIYHKILELARTRMERWRAPDLDQSAVEVEVVQEITARRDAWVCARDSGIAALEDAEYMHDLYLVWGAKITLMLGEEWKSRKEGLDIYESLYSTKQLPWQRMVKDMRTRMAS